MVPHSPHDDAWGATAIPLAVIRNGKGRTVIIEGGNHGDEYEGPIVISELINSLDQGEIQGCLILLSAVNVHAVTAGCRTSPVDGLNFNRTFPGNPLGSLTEQISAFLSDHLFPRADAFLDLHSGGSSLVLLPSAIVEPSDNAELLSRNIAAVQAFDAPLTVVISNLGDPRTTTASDRQQLRWSCRSGPCRRSHRGHRELEKPYDPYGPYALQRDRSERERTWLCPIYLLAPAASGPTRPSGCLRAFQDRKPSIVGRAVADPPSLARARVACWPQPVGLHGVPTRCQTVQRWIFGGRRASLPH
jgi:hypothetical protein